MFPFHSVSPTRPHWFYLGASSGDHDADWEPGNAGGGQAGGHLPWAGRPPGPAQPSTRQQHQATATAGNKGYLNQGCSGY